MMYLMNGVGLSSPSSSPMAQFQLQPGAQRMPYSTPPVPAIPQPPPPFSKPMMPMNSNNFVAVASPRPSFDGGYSAVNGIASTPLLPPMMPNKNAAMPSMLSFPAPPPTTQFIAASLTTPQMHSNLMDQSQSELLNRDRWIPEPNINAALPMTSMPAPLLPPMMPNKNAALSMPSFSALPPTTKFVAASSPSPQMHSNLMDQSQSDVLDLARDRWLIPAETPDFPDIRLPKIFPYDVNCSPDIFRSTLNSIPQTNDLLKKSRLPLGLILHPFKDMKSLSVLSTGVIVRCRACRTYINPFVQFPDQRHWKCNICNRINEIPEEFHFDPVSKSYGDPQRRPEIKHATVEFIAPAEYMVRPPQAAAYLFCLDVSGPAIECGYLGLFCDQLCECLDHLPGDNRCVIGFLTFDYALHFYQWPKSAGEDERMSQPRQMVISELDEPFLPHSIETLLVNLHDRKDAVRNFLRSLPDMFVHATLTAAPSLQQGIANALGAALQSAYELMSQIGGRVTVFQASLPSIGPGKLEHREDPNERAARDVKHLSPATDFYKQLALKCSGQQVAVDVFLVAGSFADLATLSCAAKYSGGDVHYYPSLHRYNNAEQSSRFVGDLRRYLTRKIGFEAVLRIRCSRGLALHTFHGNAFVRSTDLLALPNINPDAGFGVQLQIEEMLDSQNVCFQAALLYTSSKGERRIRVHTLCLPVTQSLLEVQQRADMPAIVGLLSRMAVDRAVNGSVSDAREALVNACVDPLAVFSQSLPSHQRQMGLLSPRSLALLPLYVLGMLKHTAFSFGQSIRLDSRVAAMCQLKSCPIMTCLIEFYPSMYALHTLAHTDSPPQRLRLSFEFVDKHGAYLLDAGSELYVYLGQAVSDRFCQELLDSQSFQSVEECILDPLLDVWQEQQPQELNSSGGQKSLKAKFIELVEHLRDRQRRAFTAPLLLIKEGSPRSACFAQRMVDDRTETTFSYQEFLQHIQKELKSS